MAKAIIAIAAIMLLGNVSLAFADDSGHATAGSLKAEQAEQKGAIGETTLNRMSGEGSNKSEHRASTPDGETSK